MKGAFTCILIILTAYCFAQGKMPDEFNMPRSFITLSAGVNIPVGYYSSKNHIYADGFATNGAKVSFDYSVFLSKRFGLGIPVQYTSNGFDNISFNTLNTNHPGLRTGFPKFTQHFVSIGLNTFYGIQRNRWFVYVKAEYHNLIPFWNKTSYEIHSFVDSTGQVADKARLEIGRSKNIPGYGGGAGVSCFLNQKIMISFYGSYITSIFSAAKPKLTYDILLSKSPGDPFAHYRSYGIKAESLYLTLGLTYSIY